MDIFRYRQNQLQQLVINPICDENVHFLLVVIFPHEDDLSILPNARALLIIEISEC